MIEKYYICTVCGYPNLSEPPWIFEKSYPSDEICPSCGTHFGYNDFGTTKEEIISRQINLRESWLKNGMKWWSIYRVVPSDWNLSAQLKNIPNEFLGADEAY